MKFKKITALVTLLSVMVTGVLAGNVSADTETSNAVSLYNTITVMLNDEQADIEAATRQRDEAQAAADQAAAMVSQLTAQSGELSGELSELNQLSEEQREQYNLIAEQLEAALEEKAEALQTYLDAEDNLEQTQETFSERISVMFEYQNKSTLEVLLDSDSIAGFFTNMELITLIADADSQAVDQMQIALDDATAKKSIAIQEAAELDAIAATKEAELEELESRIGVTTAALESISSELTSWQQQEDQLNEYAVSLDSQIAQLSAQYEANLAATQAASNTTADTASGSDNSSSESTQPQATATPAPTSAPSGAGYTTDTGYYTGGTGNGMLTWPVACTRITSYYGYRIHPVTGVYKFHSGVDIGCGYGDAIAAAASGTVILVSEPVEGQNTGGTGYGNYCIIDHGNGLCTLYGHCRDVYVSEGQYVNTGDIIAEVGSTGTSSGSHLHFEVRVNGSSVDPLGYL